MQGETIANFLRAAFGIFLSFGVKVYEKDEFAIVELEDVKEAKEAYSLSNPCSREFGLKSAKVLFS